MDQTLDKIRRSEDAVPSVTSRMSLILESPPSCLEFSPLDPELFIVGTYQLNAKADDGEHVQSKPQLRSGSIIVFRLRRDEM